MKRSTLVVLAIAFLGSLLDIAPGAVNVARAETLSEMRERWLDEAQRLESLNARYVRLAAETSKAHAALLAASDAVNTALADPKVPVADLRDLEQALTAARDEALQYAEDAASLRRDIYDQLDVVSQLGTDVEQFGSAKLVEDAGISGMWRAEWEGSRDFGLVKLQADGAIITGSYRLTNGNAGSLKGTFGGGELRLDIISSSRGFAGTLTSRLSDDGNQLDGSFVRNELAGAGQAVGRLTMQRLDDDEASGILDRMR